ncbi:hypothetical protein ACFXPN_29555 [Streptomyces griseorubiginosus]|uniref:hypothetical protein n=1 Tax=Streptomyces griseorubiginosus TaxID=67304 RepID=UPI00368AB51D
MNGRICLTPQQAFEAGFEEPCEHQVPDPNDCPTCRLTGAEIRRLAVLLRNDLPAVARTTAA